MTKGVADVIVDSVLKRLGRYEGFHGTRAHVWPDVARDVVVIAVTFLFAGVVAGESTTLRRTLHATIPASPLRARMHNVVVKDVFDAADGLWSRARLLQEYLRSDGQPVHASFGGMLKEVGLHFGVRP
jgi:hypothetical protein